MKWENYNGTVTEPQLVECTHWFADVLRSNAHDIFWPLLIDLRGELGAGKTTFVRSLLQALGHEGAVKSPTYGLLEPYPDILNGIFHWDLYRLSDPEELESLGFRDYWVDQSCCIVEWAINGKGYLPDAQIVVELEFYSETKRRLSICLP